MTLKEKLSDFAGALALAADYPPNDYPSWSSWTYETHMADLSELWAHIRGKLTTDMTIVPFIDEKLQEAIAAFDVGDKDTGRRAILAIYNLDLKALR